MGKELWVMGVPFMDSMSFHFLPWASYLMALMAVYLPCVPVRHFIF